MDSHARTAFAALLFLLIPPRAGAQEAVLRGTVMDGKRLPLPGVHIRLTDLKDTTVTYIATSGSDGKFAFPGVPARSYRMVASAVGHREVAQVVNVAKGPVTLAPIVMADLPAVLGEIVINGRVPPAVQNGDTTEFNASAFKTNRDATAEELLTKMPGITVQNGTVQAGGENVQRVLVDGKPYFGDDPTLALRNLPAEVIDKIQVFDQMSDQAQFTGFDDGQSVKALNIMTKRRRDMSFGKMTAGYGDDQRYEAGGNANVFDGDRRISVLGLANNINEQNFTTQDLLGVVSSSNQVRGPGQNPRRRGGGGGGPRRNGQFTQPGGGGPNPFQVGQQQGINTTSMLGTNYSDSLAAGLFTQGSYFFNRTDNTNDQQLAREYLLGGDSTSLYNQQSTPKSKNFNHRINARIVDSPDSTNSFLVLPQLYFQSNRSDNLLLAGTTQDGATLASQSSTDNLSSGYDLSGHVVYRHRFEAPGRTVSLDLGMDANRKRTTGLVNSWNENPSGSSSAADSLNQQSNYLATGRTLNASLVYTEPLWASGLFQISYRPSYAQSNADKQTFDFDPVLDSYSDFDGPLSNAYTNEFITQNAGFGIRHRVEGMNVMAGVSYQVSNLRGDLPLEPGIRVDRRFGSVLPSALLLFTMPDHKALRMFYRTSMVPPSISQLQDVVDNSNPLLLTTGNPSLIPSYTQTMIARYSQTDPLRSQSLFILLAATSTAHYIGNATLIPSRDTSLANGTTLSQGTQLTSPVNMNGYVNVRSFFTYGFPFELISSTLNLNGGVTFTRTPGLVNGDRNIANSYALSEGFVVGSNISENFDFTVSYLGSYTIARNTLQADANSNYYSHSAALKWTWLFWDGVVLRNDITNSVTSGLAEGYNQDIFLWNISLGKKFFQDERGELKVGVADLLRQNTNVNRAITETYVEDTRNEALTRYVMASFTYTLR